MLKSTNLKNKCAKELSPKVFYNKKNCKTKMANKIVFPQPVPAMYCYKLMNLDRTFSLYRCKVNVLSEGAKTYEVRLLEQIRLHAIGDVIKVKKKNITF